MENPGNGKIRAAADSETPVSAGIAAATAGAHGVIDDASGAARPVLERIVGEAHAVVDRLADAADDARGRIDQTGGQLGRAGSRASAELRGYVGAHPVAAVGIALAAGFLVSRLIRSR